MGTIAKRESLGRTELESLVTLALDEARRLGVDQAEVVASQDRVVLGDIEPYFTPETNAHEFLMPSDRAGAVVPAASANVGITS